MMLTRGIQGVTLRPVTSPTEELIGIVSLVSGKEANSHTCSSAAASKRFVLVVYEDEMHRLDPFFRNYLFHKTETAYHCARLRCHVLLLKADGVKSARERVLQRSVKAWRLPRNQED